ncbi:MAG: hypothetical protein QOD47_507 [Gemmatimonadaceae bacterium]|jgi:hypothetical protein|nr:hypothetical protein [Gemmatimonadaceae bacterium]
MNPVLGDPNLRGHVWIRPRLTLEQRAVEIEQLEKQVRSQSRRLYIRYAFEYFVWFAGGLYLLYWSFHTTDTRYAGLAFWGGMGVGDAGMLWTLIRARADAERRGL